MTWLPFLICLYVAAFLAIGIGALRGLGYDIGTDRGEDQ
jgi:hypothetical protein